MSEVGGWRLEAGSGKLERKVGKVGHESWKLKVAVER